MSSITPKKLLKFLEKKGFYIARQSGSHMILHKTDDNLKPGTLSSILKQAGVDRKELFNNAGLIT